ncbi:MAG: YggS family pyridoxal phosphate-dependent enzyme [Elusimicrobiota bacterium]|jgi:pyridoxal phosphate enzyme (YggS family)|nr:YggS family pyridoxal phosphate-dependent enzyme [Elusimicrobiota bacterium]
MENISENVDNVKSIVKSIQNDENPIEIVAVTKTFDAKTVLNALNCGLKHIGENKIQEALPKFDQLGDSLKGITKHFIGHLQSNKVKKAVENFDLIQSLDSLALAQDIDKHSNNIGKVQNCLIEVKISKEPSKTGINPQELEDFYSQCLKLSNILIKGLMIIAPLNAQDDEARYCFKEGYRLFSSLKDEDFKILSMGMSADYQIAIEEGANMIRIGSAIFGQRDYAN